MRDLRSVLSINNDASNLLQNQEWQSGPFWAKDSWFQSADNAEARNGIQKNWYPSSKEAGSTETEAWEEFR